MSESSRRTRIDPRPSTVQLFVTCLVDQFRPQVGEAVVSVLERQGLDVEFPAGQTCCGQPAFNAGFRAEAREVARRFIEVFEATEGPIVTPSGSCGAMVRNFYPILFRDEPATLKRVEKLSERLYEFSEFLVDSLGVDSTGGAVEGTSTYHRCCHLLRELGVDEQPEALLRSAAGDGYRELERAEVCCGFGGAFSVKMPDISTAMLDEKLGYVAQTGAETLVAGDTGCIMHMEGGLRRKGSHVKVVHLAEFLDMAAGRKPAEAKARR
jgi:L-lactate dehydrogenase complex protein LldE